MKQVREKGGIQDDVTQTCVSASWCSFLCLTSHMLFHTGLDVDPRVSLSVVGSILAPPLLDRSQCLGHHEQ